MKIKKKLLINILVLLFVVIGIYTTYIIFNGPSSLSELIVEVWDGNSVSSTFYGGNGTEKNPYQIQTGSDFIYFQKILKESPNIYSNANYILVADIHLGNHEISPLTNFEGILDGNGYTISNFEINNGNIIDDITYYGLFDTIENSTIKNLNITNAKIVQNTTDNPVYFGVLSGKISASSCVVTKKISSGKSSSIYSY